MFGKLSFRNRRTSQEEECSLMRFVCSDPLCASKLDDALRLSKKVVESMMKELWRKESRLKELEVEAAFHCYGSRVAVTQSKRTSPL